MTVKRFSNEREQYSDSNGTPLSGGKLFFYTAGSSTKQNTYTTSAGSVANANPIVLDSAGRPTTEIWLTTSTSYKVILATSTDSDPPVSPIWTEDNITGVNDFSTTLNEWNTGPAPTYVGVTSFTLLGDQTSTFTKGLRLKFTVTAGTVYGSILTSVFTTLTTVTLEMDSGQALDSGLSAVFYSLLNSVHPGMPPYLETMPIAVDHTDPTKRIKLSASNITTGTARTLSAQDATGSIALTSEFAYLGLPGPTGRLLLPNDYISGFGLTTASTTTYDIAAGQAMDSTNTTNILGSAITAKSQSAWAAGSAAGGKLSAAAMANNTWYYWFALWKTADGTVDYGFDVATTPTLPSGYSKYRYIGARKTDLAATTWPTFIQHGDEVIWSTPPATDLNATVATGSRTLLTVNVPAVKVRWNGNVYIDSGAAGNQYIYITDPAVADVAPGTGAPPASPLATIGLNGTAAQTATAAVTSWTNTSSQIGIRSANATPTVRIQTIGWIDPRGKPV